MRKLKNLFIILISCLCLCSCTARSTSLQNFPASTQMPRPVASSRLLSNQAKELLEQAYVRMCNLEGYAYTGAGSTQSDYAGSVSSTQEVWLLKVSLNSQNPQKYLLRHCTDEYLREDHTELYIDSEYIT